MNDRITNLGAIVTRIPEQGNLPDLVARVTRLWAEIHAANPELALELARKLPEAEISLHLGGTASGILRPPKSMYGKGD